MFDLLSFPSKEIQALIRRLAANPLLAAFFLISPPDALRYMGFGMFALLFDTLRPTAQSDINQVQQLIQALDNGRTSLEEAQVIRTSTPAEAAPPQPDINQPSGEQRPDVRIHVSKATLQHVVALYTQHTFNGQEFTLPTQRWGQVTVVGETLSLELTSEQARIVTTFQGTAVLRMPLPLGRTVDLGAVNSPLVLDILTDISFGPDDMLTLDIRHGEIRLTRVPLPEMVANELARQFIATVPTIPLIKIPTRFEFPHAGAGNAVVVAFKTGPVWIEAEGLWLAFRLDQGEGVERGKE